jgi:hypothetical protein
MFPECSLNVLGEREAEMALGRKLSLEEVLPVFLQACSFATEAIL